MTRVCALRLDRDLDFLLGHQRHQSHDDDDQEEKANVEGWRTGGVMAGSPGQAD